LSGWYRALPLLATPFSVIDEVIPADYSAHAAR
jgi:hypothetical protein